MNPPTIFISYSPKDEQEKEALLTHLAVLSDYELWSDDKIRPGADWRDELEQAMGRAKVAILLITANFLASKFIKDAQIPAL